MVSIIKIIKKTLLKKTLFRIYFEENILSLSSFIKGRVLDIGSGSNPSYRNCLPVDIEYLKSEYITQEGIDLVVDFNVPFEMETGTVDTILLFNNLYIAEKPEFTLNEIYRVLKVGGHALISSPYATNEMPEPHDFLRFTSEGLSRLFSSSGFEVIEKRFMGDRFSVCAYALHPFFVFSIVRALANILAVCFDMFIPRKIRNKHPLPMGYFYVIRKK